MTPSSPTGEFARTLELPEGLNTEKIKAEFVNGVLQARIANERTGQPGPACCIEKAFYWDEAIVYELQRKWRTRPGRRL
jgi:hypothetical protein